MDATTIKNIPNTVTTIGEDSLGYCYNVKAVEILSSVTTIEKGALPCMRIESIYIPSSVTYIDPVQSLPKTCIIYGEAGSYAEQWVKDRRIYTFVAR